jgi:anti-sigma regulatory factor (Ser/Thr protein kinase)
MTFPRVRGGQVVVDPRLDPAHVCLCSEPHVCDRTANATLALPADRTAPQLARRFVESASCGSHHPDMDDALLLTSETVSNAVTHGRPPLTICINCDGGSLRVEVRDANPTLPTLGQHSADTVNGRGMPLIESLAAGWGVEQTADGKYVWFTLPASP